MAIKRWLRPFQIGLIHSAVAVTLLPINSTLNRVMIKELGLSATLVSVLVSLPYLLSPIQVAIGSYSDRTPILGRHRLPYIVIGLAMCIAGSWLSPHAALLLVAQRGPGLALSVLAFGLWGMGFNFATVSYFSMASEHGNENGRGTTISIMFTMMILTMITLGIITSKMVEEYTHDKLISVFWLTSVVAVVMGLLGIIALEPPAAQQTSAQREERYSWGRIYATVSGNVHARQFFIYLILLLAAILGQDVLLEPYAAQAFGMSVDQTTRITSIWGTFFLIALIVAGPLQRRVTSRRLAHASSWTAIVSFLLIVFSGALHSQSVFYVGVVLLGTATGLSTVSNLSLMLRMTTAESVGLYMGAWGAASAFARLTGTVVGGVVRDGVTAVANGNLVIGYEIVFALEALFLVISLGFLRAIDVEAFQKSAETPMSYSESAALVGEVGS